MPPTTRKPRTRSNSGGKFQYWNRRARTNFAIFYNDISDLQVAQFVGLQFTVLNAASAETYGAELESSFEVVDGVTLQLDATYLPHAEYGDDPTIGILAEVASAMRRVWPATPRSFSSARSAISR
ncbi:MAG: TonB-dependent receptor [Deltaproteobacteria bacterium]|nr:TonB-dependent receptor [Deltaproteobacteria bacterium]